MRADATAAMVKLRMFNSLSCRSKCHAHPKAGNEEIRAYCGFYHVLQHRRYGEVIRQVKIIKPFDQLLVRPAHDLGLRISDAPAVQGIDRKRRLESEPAIEEVHACAANVAVAVTAE